MDRFTSIFKLHQLLKNHCRPVPMRVITERLECSRSTASRVIEEMRNILGAPLEYDRKARGYHYVSDQGAYELPGLWFSRDEMRALVAFEEVFKGMGSGMLADMLAPVIDRVNVLLRLNGPHDYAVEKRFLFAGVQAKPVESAVFTSVVTAVMKRLQLHLEYQGRHSGETTVRDVSPQRLLNYRGNWYLGAWCHLRDDLRTFALDKVRTAHVMKMPALEVDETTLAGMFGASYGIYSGEPVAWAVLRFSREQAPWEVFGQWHPRQESRFLPDGRYELKIPYSSTFELVHEILARTPDVEVVEPPELRALVLEKLKEGVRRMEGPDPK